MTAHALGLKIIVCWVPGHCGIRGNEIADKNAALAALRSDVEISQVPYEDMKPVIRRRLRERWQQHWDEQTHNKLHTIKPQIGKYMTDKQNRFNETSMCRLRIGHTHGTHSYLLTGSLPPVCSRCAEGLSVLHILIECKSLNDARQRHFPDLYKYRIPLHPSLFLGDEPVVTNKRVLSYLAEADFLNLISYHM